MKNNIELCTVRRRIELVKYKLLEGVLHNKATVE